MKRKAMVERQDSQLSIRRQCELLAVNRNRLESPQGHGKIGKKDLTVCRRLDELHLEEPAYGSRRLTVILGREAQERGEKEAPGRGRIRELMRRMGIEAVYPRPRTTLRALEHKTYPYLLRGRLISKPNEVWCTDITYVPMGTRGYAYVVAVMDWHSRAVLSWKMSNTLDGDFCEEAFREAVEVTGTAPEIFNTDQGCQFTAKSWIDLLQGHGVRISMDGKGRWMDNVFIERLWWSLKYEDVYLKDYADLHELEQGLERWFGRYNHWRPHQALGNETPWSVYKKEPKPAEEAA